MRKLFLILFLLITYHLSLFTVLYAAQREVTLTTYYPAPYGEYDELKARKVWFGEDDSGDLLDHTITTQAIVNVGDVYTGDDEVGIFAQTDGYGVFGRTDSATADHAGVYGRATNEDGQVHGVLGITRSIVNGAAGVKGDAIRNPTTGRIYGVYGRTNSRTADAAGVYGLADNTSGKTYGVYAQTDSSNTSSAGIYAFAELGWAGLFNSPKGVAISDGNLFVGGTTAATSDGTVYAKNLPVIQSGFTLNDGTNPREITFPERFSKVPNVVISRNYYDEDEEMPGIVEVKKAYFQIKGNAVNWYSGNGHPGCGFYWIAIESD